MTPERWQQVAEIYQEALAQPAVTRASFVAERCGDDAALRREVESLLAQEQASVVIDRRVDGVAASVLGRGARLTPGSHVGPYRVVDLLGEGGMGQVYRARDTKLQRDVALKILPDAFVHDADRVARFTREAQVLASLNHPNIGAIHGFEDSGDVHALVLELVEGPTLADRIARGPLPVDEALPIARQIAEALEAAHEHGIVHRDLKPANIKVRDDGTVKVLDFGLAKLTTSAAASGAAPLLTHSPTLLSPAVTTAGVILGTAAYMSPEQAKGRPADKRSDVWAFGCVLYEMLTGKRAFEGEDVSETLAAVLKSEVDWSRLPPELPAGVGALIQGCLTKDRRLRVGDISAALFILRAPPSLGSSAPAGRLLTPKQTWRRAASLLALAVVLVAVTGAGTWYATRPVPSFPLSSVIEVTPFWPGSTGSTRRFAISPDSSTIVYVGVSSSNGQALYTKAMNGFAPPALLVEGGRWPFLDPSGEWVGYLDVGTQALKKVPLRGGPPQDIAKLGDVANSFRGASWAADGSIVYALGGETSRPQSSGLWRLAPNGRTPERIVGPDREKGEGDYFSPHVLPDSESVLFVIAPPMIDGAPRPEAASIAVVDIRASRPTPTVIIRGGSDPRYVAGHLVYLAGNSVRAVRFDVDTLTASGASVEVWARVGTGRPAWTGAFHVTGDGTLVFGTDGDATALRNAVWVDRTGNEEALSPAPPPMEYAFPRLSNDLERFAVDVGGFTGDRDVWTWHLRAGVAVKVSNHPSARDRTPAWTSDDAHLVFASYRDGRHGIFVQRSDGTGDAQRLTRSELSQYPLSVYGSTVAINQMAGPIASADAFALQLPKSPALSSTEASLPVTDLVRTPAGDGNPAISHDGRWLAYQSNDSGMWQIYVSPYPDARSGRREPVGMGVMPVWSRDSNELFYISPAGQLMSVPVRLGIAAPWRDVAGPPKPLFDVRKYAIGNAAGQQLPQPFAMYDYDHRRRRFLMLKPVDGDATADPDEGKLFVQQGWLDEMKRLVASARQ